MPPSASARSRVVGESNRAMDGDSVEITRLRAQPAKHRAQVLEVARDQVLDAVDLLPAPAHRKQGGIEQRLAPALRDAWPDDHVDRAVLVLPCDEERAAGRLSSEEHTSELQSLKRIS